jgi:hypothetical protein
VPQHWGCGYSDDCYVAPVAAPPPSLFPLPSLRGSSTQLSPESISVTTPLWG